MGYVTGVFCTMRNVEELDLSSDFESRVIFRQRSSENLPFHPRARFRIVTLHTMHLGGDSDSDSAVATADFLGNLVPVLIQVPPGRNVRSSQILGNLVWNVQNCLRGLRRRVPVVEV